MKLMKLMSFWGLPLTIVLILGGATAYYFFWHWRPFTQNAFLFADTRPVTALVEGYITEIPVRNNQFVRKGDVLLRTFRPPYELKRRQLEHRLEALQARRESLASKIRAAESRIGTRKAVCANETYLSSRADRMYRQAAVSQAYAEERLRAMQGAESSLHAEEHEKNALEAELRALCAEIRLCGAELELAKIREAETEVRALSDGFITSMSVSPGGHCRPGDVLFGFVDTSVWYVQANFKESELSELRRGMEARIWLWQYPGRVFRGIVCDTGFGAERRRFSPHTGLPVVEKENEWFLLPQRFPVQIRLLDPPSDPSLLHVGASAYVELNCRAYPVRQIFWQLFPGGKS